MPQPRTAAPNTLDGIYEAIKSKQEEISGLEAEIEGYRQALKVKMTEVGLSDLFGQSATRTPATRTRARSTATATASAGPTPDDLLKQITDKPGITKSELEAQYPGLDMRKIGGLKRRKVIEQVDVNGQPGYRPV